jgi:hypothetical protein
VGDLYVIHPPGVTNRCRGNVYNSPIVCVVLERTYKHASIVFRYVNRALQLPVSHDSNVPKFLCLRSVQNSVIDDTRHNSGTPGAISTKLGTHMSICM